LKDIIYNSHVSIHAPTWGATFHCVTFYVVGMFQSTHPRGVRRGLPRCIVLCHPFQSTHPRGVRPCQILSCRQMSCFNPRTHVGCDLRILKERSLRQRFNPRTHVGCDQVHLACNRLNPAFQSTHPRGVRRLPNTFLQTNVMFQSTHPRGVRPCRIRSCRQTSCFNPRTHVGCDIKPYLSFVCETVSIHAPTWGATVNHV